MRVFVTGASGWIGSATVDELLAAGHEVTGLARSGASATALQAKGARVRRGHLDDLASIRAGAEEAEAVIHLANKHDFSNPAASSAAERAAVQTICDALAGTDRPFLFASGVAGLAQGRPATEDDVSSAHGPHSPRGGSENLALEFTGRGVHSVSLRFAPTVHGAADHGFIAVIAALAREKGISGYPGDGTNRWAAVHRSDAARLAALALEKAPAGARLHAVAEQGCPRPRDRGGDRPCVRPSRHLGQPRRRPGPLRVDRQLLRDGPPGDQHRDAAAPRLGTYRTDPHPGPRRGRVLAALTPGRRPPPPPRTDKE